MSNGKDKGSLCRYSESYTIQYLLLSYYDEFLFIIGTIISNHTGIAKIPAIFLSVNLFIRK